ncbi:hypothetical protein Gohar_009942 [Gossypium harknessii]|uniref:Trichome birefringence-like N-terminal domain-containing protein n=1 Tax=Gossypium harknessii TaxID=34285 RepID=A0A7J9GPC6_9ROSI|nr:hypothetical protein [Gossypium harknessii]
MGPFGFAVFFIVTEFWQAVNGSRCNVYKGKWAYDASYPLYNFTDCPFILEQFNCQHNGRPDHLYQKFRWQPTACILPSVEGRSNSLLRETFEVLSTLWISQRKVLAHVEVLFLDFTESPKGFTEIEST